MYKTRPYPEIYLCRGDTLLPSLSVLFIGLPFLPPILRFLFLRHEAAPPFFVYIESMHGTRLPSAKIVLFILNKSEN